MYAWDGACRLPGNFFRWTLAGQCGRIFGWKLEMDPGLGIGRGESRLGNMGGVLVRNSGRPSGWGNRMEFWSGNVKVYFSMKWMEMWSVGPK